MATKNMETRPINSYDEIMKVFRQNKGLRLTTEELFKVSLRNVVKIKNQDDVDNLWNKLRTDVSTKGVKNYRNSPQKVYVRGHGRNGSGNRALIALLLNVFGREFQIDGSNNSRPQSILNKYIKVKYEDYQVSHLFEERTCNPFLFGAPWMICYAPKILDPFTGHESKGFPKLTQSFVRWAFMINKKYIEDYNKIIIDYWDNLKTYFSIPSVKFTQQSKKNMVLALAPLVLSYEQLPPKERKEAYLHLFDNYKKPDWQIFINQEQFIDVNGQSI